DNNDTTQRERPTSEQIAASERRRYIYSGLALCTALFAFVLQTETAGYISATLGYKKPIFMMYITHGSWIWLEPLQFFAIGFSKQIMKRPGFSWKHEWKSHLNNLRGTAAIALSYSLGNLSSYMMKTTLKLVCALTVAGASWYIAVNLTTPSDLTAIYNTSAFFAYAFSVPILKDKFSWLKSGSVALAIVGVVIVAYSGPSSADSDFPNRGIGNLVIAVGAVLYGLYEVLYKRLACPPGDEVSPRRQALFANLVGSLIGMWTLALVWTLLLFLHLTGIEKFELPSGSAVGIIIASVIGNVLFSASFLILMALTSPVLSSVAALLTIFLVALVDWLLFGKPLSLQAIIGGVIIIVAFILLSYASWAEISGSGEDIYDDLD
ncbi:hypothetical protein CANCADRAFT_12260, partial [Tortispora caseinolytica NRRL Y-17796]